MIPFFITVRVLSALAAEAPAVPPCRPDRFEPTLGEQHIAVILADRSTIKVDKGLLPGNHPGPRLLALEKNVDQRVDELQLAGLRTPRALYGLAPANPVSHSDAPRGCEVVSPWAAATDFDVRSFRRRTDRACG